MSQIHKHRNRVDMGRHTDFLGQQRVILEALRRSSCQKGGNRRYDISKTLKKHPYRNLIGEDLTKRKRVAPKPCEEICSGRWMMD